MEPAPPPLHPGGQGEEGGRRGDKGVPGAAAAEERNVRGLEEGMGGEDTAAAVEVGTMKWRVMEVGGERAFKPSTATPVTVTLVLARERGMPEAPRVTSPVSGDRVRKGRRVVSLRVMENVSEDEGGWGAGGGGASITWASGSVAANSEITAPP